MTDDTRVRLWTNPTKKIPDGVIPRDVDREDLIKKCIAYGVEPVYSEGDDRVIWVYFLPEEIEVFENNYFSNKTIVLSTIQWSYANDWWRDAMVMHKSKMRWHRAQLKAKDGN